MYIIVILLLFFQKQIYALESFDPFKGTDLCTASISSCSFELHATATMTMFYKNRFRVVTTNDGILHHYNNPNETIPMEDVLTGDGYPKLVYVFNNSLPGPVLHVYQHQMVHVRIFNDFPTESLSVHFHGIRQVNTPESDGIGRLTQLSILPGSSFLHKFVAIDAGTFWYHSHVQSQTAMGLMGGFIVHPMPVDDKEEQGEFVLLLNDWQHFYTSEQHHLLIESGQFYPNDLESLTQSGTIDFFEAVDGSRAAEAFVTSILINGRGRYIDPRKETKGFSTTPFECLKITSQQNISTYRLRLINGGSVFSLKFSIDKHPLKVIASDGIPFAEPILVDQLIIGLVERYDIIIDNLTAINNKINYWIRVDTMDKHNNPRWHGLAILQYAPTNEIPTTEPQHCTELQPCRILNCPFSQYGPNESNQGNPFICLTPSNITTHEDYIDYNLIDEKTPMAIKKTLSLTMAEHEDDQSGFESFNYVGMKYPSMTEHILNNPRLARELLPCSNRLLHTESGEKCYHNIVAQYNDTIELLLVNHDDDQHPLHLHGSYFHIVEQGLAQLNTSTGEFIANNPNVQCNEHAVCICNQTNAACTTNNMRLVKDTIQLPKGGYMRIRFRAQNPGVWLFHCHTEPHLDRGMAIVFHIAEDRLPTNRIS
ncbi:unnamed protein product [Adineta steineri]|uniref:Uncharacterized protein n=1 Tax=Adineta steineri TaxID=433720 RepID=A0A819KT45_9BILA|nr:unnamed protein product [Adineta steineri]CAF3949759.1 unnamed protein product [Adineta steineri]